MAQYNTFFIPHGDAGVQQEALNVFLRSHRVLAVEKGVFPNGWAFCVEWIDGSANGVATPFAAYQREKIDYMKVLSPEVFERFSELRKRRREIAESDGVKAFVATYETTPGRGLPIGNLTSQYLANLYLDQIDRFGRDGARPSLGYVRYMDDFVFWCDDKNALQALRGKLTAFVEGQLGLSPKQTPFVNKTSAGMDFLGLRVYPHVIRANRASLDRFKRKVRLYDRELSCGKLDEATYQQRMSALSAFLEKADTLAWRKEFLRKEEGRRRKASGSENRAVPAAFPFPTGTKNRTSSAPVAACENPDDIFILTEERRWR